MPLESIIIHRPDQEIAEGRRMRMSSGREEVQQRLPRQQLIASTWEGLLHNQRINLASWSHYSIMIP